MQDLDHKHMLVTALFQTPPQSIEILDQWLRDLVDAVDMKILVEPKLVKCDTFGNEGITGACVIETSHCTFHIWDGGDPPYMKFDLYSCKRFDPTIVAEHFKQLGAVSLFWTMIDRNDGIHQSAQGDQQFIEWSKLLSADEQRALFARDGSDEFKQARRKYNNLRKRYSPQHQYSRAKYRREAKTQLNGIIARCKKKNLDYNLTQEWVLEALSKAQERWPKLTFAGCPQDSFWYANVDRKDPTKGYTQDNCHIIPRALNVAKWNWNKAEIEELKELIKDL